jgi:hypothetical protein
MPSAKTYRKNPRPTTKVDKNVNKKVIFRI